MATPMPKDTKYWSLKYQNSHQMLVVVNANKVKEALR